MPVDWKTKESYQRLLAAMVAAQGSSKDMKLDFRKIATMYGNGATYDSIEGRFRIIRKEAEVLRQEVESGARPTAPARGPGSNPSTPATTPKKPRASNVTTGSRKNGAVAGSRVEKTPTKKSKTATINTINLDDDDTILIKQEGTPGSTSAGSSTLENSSYEDHGNGHQSHSYPSVISNGQANITDWHGSHLPSNAFDGTDDSIQYASLTAVVGHENGYVHSGKDLMNESIYEELNQSISYGAHSFETYDFDTENM